jgi:hypothetical protein
MGHLVKLGFPCHVMTYVRAQVRTSAVWVLGENLIFSPLFAYPPTPKATRNYLKPSSLVCNLYTT